MKAALTIALAFASLVPLLNLDTSSTRHGHAAPAHDRAAGTHVG